MKVLIVHNALWSHYKGSVFSALNRLAIQRNVSISFVHVAQTFAKTKALSEVDLSYHQYPFQLLFDSGFDEVSALRRSFKLVRAASSIRADIVVLPGYEDLSYWALWLFCILTKTPTIFTLDSTQRDHKRVWYKEIVKKLFVSQCKGAFCYGTRAAEYIEALGMPAGHIMRRCQATSVDRLLEAAHKLSSAPTFAERAGATRRRLLFVGRLSLEKGLETLLKAFDAFSRKETDYELYLVGDGPQREYLKELTAKLGMESSVVFTGPKNLEEIVGYYLTAYALILPSISEPWGLVVNEAFLMSCPAIVSENCGCAPDLIIEDKTGFQFRVGDTESLLDALQKMSAVKDRRDEMGQACLELIKQYTPEAAAGQMLRGIEIVSSVYINDRDSSNGARAPGSG